MKTSLRWFASRVVILVTAVGMLGAMAWVVQGRARMIEEQADQQTIPVRIFQVASTKPSTTRSLTGVVRARHETELSFRVGGKITNRRVDTGARVNLGDELFRLDDEDYRLELSAAEADLSVAVAASRQAEADELRMRTLKQNRTVSDSEYDNALAQRDIAFGRRETAERALELARNRLSYTQLLAPASGTVMEILAEQGQVVAAGRGVARLAHGDELEVAVEVPERWIDFVRTATTTVTYWSLPAEHSTAQLRELSPTADPVTRTYEARFTIAGPAQQIQLGMTATLHLHDSQEAEGVLLPAGAVMGDSQGTQVWKVVDESGSVEPLDVEVLKYGSEQVVVRGDLSVGDRIVSAGVQKLNVGMRVRKWEELR